MSRSLNKVMLIGNLGQDPSLKYTPSGVAVATFSMAMNESWKDADGNTQEKTEWVNVVAWKKLAEICGEWLKKGQQVYIEGKIQTRSYEKDGVKKYMTEVVADQMLMLGSKGEQTARTEPERKESPSHSSEVPKDESDLPF